MPQRYSQAARLGLLALFLLFAAALAPTAAKAVPSAEYVVDARTGEVLHQRNADTQLHPASLTKMMTLYIAFQAVERGEIGLDTIVTVTADAAAMPPSKLGLRSGQQIALRYLIRAAAVRSANDAATAIGVALGGSQEAFARRMNATAQAMGMTNTHFINMNGLTAEGHYSTAHDMTILGRHVIYDFPQYYNLFSRRTADAGMAQVNNTNTRFLNAYEGADGIKTGYTDAAGYNLVASAQHGQQRIIATYFGGTSTAQRNARIAELLDLGFSRAPSRATIRAPEAPPAVTYAAPPDELVASRSGAHVIRVSGLVNRAVRPPARPASIAATAAPDSAQDRAIDEAMATALLASATSATSAEAGAAFAETIAALRSEDAAEGDQTGFADASAQAPATVPAPPPRPTALIMTAEAIAPADLPDAEPEIITRLSTSGGHHWGINVGRFNSHGTAERVLLRVALNESATLEGALRRVVTRANGYDANFMGLTREGADLACRRLQARGTTCFMIGEES